MSIVNTQEPLPFVASSEVFTKTYKSLSERYSGENRCNSFPHIVVSPIHYESGYAYPLIVWLHDAGKSEQEIVEVAPKISSRNYVAVAPRGLKSFQKRIVRSFVNGRLVDKKSWEEPCNNWTESDEDVSEAENLVLTQLRKLALSITSIDAVSFYLGVEPADQWLCVWQCAIQTTLRASRLSTELCQVSTRLLSVNGVFLGTSLFL